MSFFLITDARVKLIFILALTLLVFLIDNLPIIVCLLLFFVIIRLITGIPFRFFAMFGTFTLLAVFIIAVQALFGPGDSYIVKPVIPEYFPVFPGWGSVKKEGLILGIVITCRLAALLVILPVFTVTTPPGQIAAGLCAFGFNYRIAFIITAAFNLIPVFRDEALVIMDAQKLRGTRKFGLLAYAGFLLPLMLGAMRKAQVSSVSMDSRAFGVYNTRTWTGKPVMKRSDVLLLIILPVLSAGLLFLNYLF